MPGKWAGIKVAGSEIIYVVLEIDSSQPVVVRDKNIGLQTGPRLEAYDRAYERVIDFLKEDKVTEVAILNSAVNHTGNPLSTLLSAELRGVVMLAAVHAKVPVRCINMGVIKKNKGVLGPNPTSEYMKDDAAWATALSGKLRIGSRDAGIAALDAIVSIAAGGEQEVS